MADARRTESGRMFRLTGPPVAEFRLGVSRKDASHAKGHRS